MTDLTGYPELTPYKGGWCGNDVFPEALSENDRAIAISHVRKLGDRLAQEGYKGFLEVDVLVDLDTGAVYLGELNPRISGVSSMTNVTAGAYADVPLFLFHLLEFMDVDYTVDVEEINERWRELAAVDVWAQLIMKEPGDDVERILAAPRTGSWRLSDDGTLTFEQVSNDWHEITTEDEAFFMRVYGPGDYRFHGADLGILVTKGRMQTTEGLTERCRRYIDGHPFATTSPNPCPSRRRHADRLRQVAPGVHAGISPFIWFRLLMGPGRARCVPEVVTVADGNGANPLAYNSTWQIRNDAWCSLEETSAQLVLAGAQHRPVAGLGKEIARLLDVLGPIERFWAFPGIQAFQKVRRLFSAGKYDRFAALVSGINRALATDSFRTGQGWDPGAEDDSLDRTAHPMEQAAVPALRSAMTHRRWPSSWTAPCPRTDGALTRRPGPGAGPSPSQAPARARPVPDDRDRGRGPGGRLSHHYRRIFHAREGSLEVHLSILDGVAARYLAPFFSALKNYSHRPTGVFHALPISHGKSVVESHWISDMLDFYGLEIFLAETSATCGGLDSLLEPTGPLREAQQLASIRSAPGRPTSSPTGPRRRTRSWCRRWSSRVTSCWSTGTATSPTTTA